jgi:predicted esterase
VDPSSAPILGIYGVEDPLASPEHGVRLQDAYERAGIGDRFDLVVVDDGPQRYQGHEIDFERFTERILGFLEEHRT